MQAVVRIEELVSKQFEPVRQTFLRLERSTAQIAAAVEAVESYKERSRAAAVAVGLFDVLAGGFMAASILLFIQGNFSPAVGLLGPALASLVGALAFRSKRIFVG